MNTLSILLLLLASLVFCVELFLLISILFNFKSFPRHFKGYPMVSVLVAARNEEACIVACINSLQNIDYQKDRIEFLIGDDQSADRTASLVKQCAAGDLRIRLFTIKRNTGSARGKANVLAHLAKQAKGTFFLFTDADTEVSPACIKTFLAAYEDQVGLISGFTTVKGRGIGSQMQLLDWVYGLGAIKVMTDWGYALTALGNNMFVSREAYTSVGGFGKMPFSITEDHELAKQIAGKGYQVRVLIDKDVHALTLPLRNLKEVLFQRKRWLHGAMQSPVLLSLFLLSQVSVLFLAGAMLCLFIKGVAMMLIGKIFIQGLFIHLLLKKAGQRLKFLNLLLFQLYFPVFLLLSLIFYFLPFKVVWKGRKY